jgi:DNA-directed RNA polymerase subunit RPC12/RpoP
MPIRFRCAYCNQLMGISRRKAGTVIRCPNCAGQVIVPNPDGAPPAVAPPPAPFAPQAKKEAPALFEGSDFDKLFDAGATGGSPPAVPKPAVFSNPGPAAAPPQLGIDVEEVAGPGFGSPGIFLTPAKLTLISVALVILLGLAFLLGLLIGRA